jgi:zinc/manganese transport system substrate-binding protein
MRPTRTGPARSRPPRPVLLLGLVALLAAACGNAEPPATDAGEQATEAGATEAPAAVSEEQAASATGGDGSEGPSPSSEEQVTVVATTSILGDVVATLVGDAGEVVTLMPPGVDPHGFEPSAMDAAMLREADLVVANGLQLEENLLSALDAAEADGVRVVTIAEQLDPIEFGGHLDDQGHEDDAHGHEDDEHGHEDDEQDDGGDDGHGHDDDGHDHGPEDPHVWLDPVRMADGARLLAAELATVVPAVPAEEWEARGEAYATELLAVHAEMDELLADVPPARRVLVTNHDALGYFADRFEFDILGTVVPGATTQVEADPRQFAQLVETVEQAQVPAIFAENTDATTLAEQLASEVLGRVDLELDVVRLYTDALGEPGSGAETYPELLRTNARLVAEALA